MKKICLVSDGFFHPPILGRMELSKTLKKPHKFSFVHAASLERLPPDLDTFSALVLHFHHKKISDQALERLDQFVRNGGGVLAIHAATASFKETLPYFEILGGRFIGHGAVETFKVRKVNDTVFTGAGDFTVRDELYIHELRPGIVVHFTARHEGQEVPVVWTYHYHHGRVCYAVPGHTVGSMRSKRYQQILQQGLEWVTA